MTSQEDWMHSAQPYLTPAGPGEADAWREGAKRAGRTGSQRLLAVEEIPAPPRIAAALRQPEGAIVVRRSRLILLDDEPFELTDSYYPAHVAKGTALAESRKIRGGAVTLLAGLGYASSTASEEVGARPPTTEEVTLLGIQPADWVLEVLRILCKSAGGPYEATIMTTPASRRTLHYTVQIG